jgi:hypothetical protein
VKRLEAEGEARAGSCFTGARSQGQLLAERLDVVPRLLQPVAGDVKSTMMLWCTRRSMAAAVVIGSLKMPSHFGERQVTGEEHTAPFLTFSQQREGHFDFLPGLADVSETVDDHAFIAGSIS